MEDFEAALAEVKPAFGAVTETLEEYRLNGILEYSDSFRHLLATCKTLVEQVRLPPFPPDPLFSVLPPVVMCPEALN